ncbi:phage tail protein [Hahella sp. KA22]|uniref:phage tail protein n=1 Tax=Hahella sp. KA22 TaxID=1628392 RepID=UPI000FDDA940|nr:tail fiber protein [Hahella sp. KA22]AZZ92669.1 phage tail protein [Hahella sp. KA22]QAY56042.1 phage tail protein [Hahella sp. KA22]
MTPYLGQISMMGFGFPPESWAQCNGQIQQITQNQALFALVGTRFGGNGTSTYALPDLRGRTPVHLGASYSSQVGVAGGLEQVTITESTMGAHIHPVYASSSPADKGGPKNDRILAETPDIYCSPDNLTTMNSQAVGFNGGSNGSATPHANMQPSLTINFCIALDGVFPPRN